MITIGEEQSREYIEVLKYLVDYVLDDTPVMKPDQTIAYYSWILKLAQEDSAYYELWEGRHIKAVLVPPV